MSASVNNRKMNKINNHVNIPCTALHILIIPTIKACAGSFTRQGHLSMVVQLMKYGADPSLIDGEGCSCVHLAAQFGHTSIVAYLIAKGQVSSY